MRNYKEHIISGSSSIREALARLDVLAKDAILFVVDDEGRLLGSLTDGDVRRGLLRGVEIGSPVTEIIQPNPRFIERGSKDIQKVIDYREGNFRVLPVLDSERRVVNVINFRHRRSYLPVDAVIMAGGRGQRLQPLTDTVPKPLLKVGDKAIMEYNLERLALYGIHDFWVSVKYLGNQIREYFGDGSDREVTIRYVQEEAPLGTIGAVSLINDFTHDYVLVTNSDILTNLDYEDFFLDFIRRDADLAVVSIPYQVSVPYAVLETSDGCVLDLKEKPVYTYYSNGGIYLMKKKVLDLLPPGGFYDATDLMEELIRQQGRVIAYPMVGYWLDIGKHEDYNKAQTDITHIRF